MAPDEILQSVEAGNVLPSEGIDPSTARSLEGYLAVGELVAIKVEAVSSYLDQSEDREVIAQDGSLVGTLCFTRNLGRVEPNALTKWQFVAYLADCEIEEVESVGYTFKYDYILIEAHLIGSYIAEYHAGAPIWGGFTHVAYSPSSWVNSASPITAKKNITPPTAIHSTNFSRYIASSNNFERFLRLYHCVELLFDYVIFKKIKRLGNDLIGYAGVIKENSRVEQDRLKILIAEFCRDRDKLASALILSAEFEDTCHEIFQIYSKDGNPLTERWTTFWPLVKGHNLSLTTVRATNITKNADLDSKLIVDVTAYWIYRIRSSIAHNRVGEFIMTDDHDEFVGAFAIPLILNVLEQMLAEPDFVALNA